MHGLRQELEEEMAAADDSDNHDLVPKKLHTEDTQVEFDPHWTELPSFTDSTTKKLKLIPWGSDKLVAVDMLHPPLARTPQHHPITFKVGVLRMNEQDRCWVRLPETPVIEVEYQVEDDMDWRRPQCVVLDSQLFIIHHVTETIGAIHSIDLNRSQQQQNQQAKQPQRTERFCRHGGWTTVRAALPKKFPLQSAASCVIGKSIVLLCKCGRPSGGEMSKEAIAYNTITKEWSNLHRTDASTTTADDELPYFGTHGAGAIRVRDSDFLVCPHFAEEGSEFLACNAANSNLSFAMAGYQDMDEDLFHGEDCEESDNIVWCEESGETCDFGGFVSNDGSSLYLLYAGGIEHDDGQNQSFRRFLRHDFSMRGCYYDENADRIYYRPLSGVVSYPEPLHPLTPRVMTKVGGWWVSGCKARPGGYNAEYLPLFQAIRVHEKKSQEPLPSWKSNFVQLGLDYYDRCLDVLYDEPIIEPERRHPTRINWEVPRSYISFLLAMDPEIACTPNENDGGKLLIQSAIENPTVVEDYQMIRIIFRANTEAFPKLKLPSPLIANLFVALQFPDGRNELVSKLESASNIYKVLRQNVDVIVVRQQQQQQQHDGGQKRKRYSVD